jgi:hypothetical protein
VVTGAIWFEDAIREWANNNQDAEETFGEIAREWAIFLRDHGRMDSVNILAETYDFIHQFSKYEANERTGDMLDEEAVRNVGAWVFADTMDSEGDGAGLPLNVTDAKKQPNNNNATLSPYYRSFWGGKYSPRQEQTHHFAFYFMLADPNDAVTGNIAAGDFPFSDPGDFLLSVVAAGLGKSYKESPRYIGQEIREDLTKDPDYEGGKAWQNAVMHAHFKIPEEERNKNFP